MTPRLLHALHNTIIWALRFPDPDLWREAVRRYRDADRAIAGAPLAEQLELHARLHDMLPSDWPLWVESARLNPSPAG